MRRTAKRVNRQIVATTWLVEQPQRVVDEVLALGTECMVSAGRSLAIEGRHARQAFLILDGEAVVTAKGREVGRLHSGDFAGEGSLLSRRPANATIVADTRLRVLVFDPRSFSSMLNMRSISLRIEGMRPAVNEVVPAGSVTHSGGRRDRRGALGVDKPLHHVPA